MEFPQVSQAYFWGYFCPQLSIGPFSFPKYKIISCSIMTHLEFIGKVTALQAMIVLV
jgi:hypothetical protein